MTDQPELVAALLSVAGVAAAAVEPADEGPGTLRIQLESGADEVGVAGEVNRLLRSRFGLAVDADRVTVVDERLPVLVREKADRPDPDGRPVGSPDPADSPAGRDQAEPDVRPEEQDRTEETSGGEPVAPAEADAEPAAAEVERTGAEPVEAPEDRSEINAARPGRLAIERVELVSAGLGTTVSVTLSVDGRAFQGSAEGTATAASLHRSVARATLRAVEAVVSGTVRFDIEHVEIAVTGTDRTALVVVTMVTGRATQRLSGASVVREDVRQAVIRAVLAAVNRRLEPMLAAGGNAPG
jgi:hypothetical protein